MLNTDVLIGVASPCDVMFERDCFLSLCFDSGIKSIRLFSSDIHNILIWSVVKYEPASY